VLIVIENSTTIIDTNLNESFVNFICVLVFLENYSMGTLMTQKLILIPIIAVLFAVGIQQAYAQVDEIDVGFDWKSKACQESYLVTDEGTFKRLDCTWLEEISGDEIISKGVVLPDIMIEEEAQTELDISDDATITPQPVIKTEQQIKIEGIITAREIIEAYGKGELDVKEFCFGGEIKENTIYYPDTDTTIHIKTPNDNVPLSTNAQFKYEHLMSEICKSEYTLDNKVHNPGRTYPGEGDVYIFEPRISFDDLFPEATVEYAKRDRLDYYFQATQQFAEEFQCSIEGKQRGLCVKAESDQPEPEPTISKEGKFALSKYWILRETGEAKIPMQEPDEKPNLTFALDQYIKSYGISEEELKEWYESRNP